MNFDFLNQEIINNINFIKLISTLQIQVISSVFLIILEISYFRRRKLPIMSSFCFTAIMIASAVFVCTDIFSTVAAFYSDLIPETALIIGLKLHTFMLELIMLLIYCYVSIINSDRQKLSQLTNILVIVIFGISITSNLFTKLEFQIINSKIYPKGIVFIIASIITFLIAILTIIKTIQNIILSPKKFLRSKNRFIVWTMGVWIIIALIQILFQNNRISSFGITLMIFIMYLGLETPDDFIDRETEALNSLALKLVLQEKINKNKKLFIINLDIEGLDKVENNFGEGVKNQLLINIVDYMNFKYHSDVYHANDNCFTILVPYFNHLKKVNIVDLILEDLEKRMKNSWRVEKNTFYLDSHCDFIRFPKDVPNNMKAAELIELIDEWHSYSEEVGFIHRANPKLLENKNRQTQILSILQNAIKNDEIEMFYQPIFNVKEEKFTNAEALVRLKDNQTIGFISPEEFIPLAEKNGLIMQLSDRIFNQVFDFLSYNKENLIDLKHIEVNLSAVQSVDADLPNLMSGLIEKYKIAPEMVNLEITESTAISSGSMLKKNMNDLKKIGCTFSMDDFGTGYSNLSQMVNVNYELIKIDKSLLWPCFDDSNPEKEKAKILLENIIKMILEMNLNIVVEGVETQEQFDYLEKLGVTYIQGYFFSKPLNQTDFLNFLNLPEKKGNI